MGHGEPNRFQRRLHTRQQPATGRGACLGGCSPGCWPSSPFDPLCVSRPPRRRNYSLPRAHAWPSLPSSYAFTYEHSRAIHLASRFVPPARRFKTGDWHPLPWPRAFPPGNLIFCNNDEVATVVHIRWMDGMTNQPHLPPPSPPAPPLPFASLAVSYR